ncbi:putative leucine--tRNA ligase, mitochondrial [Frankliniella fusca]|uniref:leucine--tRNA ligase n=1 Tax=Frankliniella fusca TaxID=407009 RepID=A0AAE1I7K4_9NEOP|nr:putative leucine--tRNA ligase, mitochondrial [Frankliniella fusca]
MSQTAASLNVERGCCSSRCIAFFVSKAQKSEKLSISRTRMIVSSLKSRLHFRYWNNTVCHLPRLYCQIPNRPAWDPQPCLTLDMKLDFEKAWKQYVDDFGLTQHENKQNAYILSMFPYPSGKLHMGHVRVYAISDTLARFYRMQGFNVLHPMGWDAFGLPAENAAIQNHQDPSTWTEENINEMRHQLKQLGCSFDWDREFATCHPSYYKWTQYIFLLMYKAGLIYRKPSLVNWDPVDKTVLADEQIDENGNSWRSGAKAEKILLTQWFVRSTKFAENLLKGLETLQKEDWDDVIKLQKSWIGEANGVVFDWNIEGLSSELSIPIWTSKPELLNKVEFIAVKPGSVLDVVQADKLVEEFQYATIDGEIRTFKASCPKVVAKNPFFKEKVPVFVVDGVLPFPPGSDTYMGVPSESEIDLTFAKSVGLSCKTNFEQSIPVETLCTEAKQKGIGGYPVSSNLKDWLISRQRYWGTPIPIVHCSSCGAVPVPEEKLPVHLPPFPSYDRSCTKIASPLAQAKEWVNTECPKCGGPAARETDTMDTFFDSSWYYLRYLDPSNETEIVSFEEAKKFLPVSVYIGGKEHGTLHLYFARIVSHFLYQLGKIPCSEPFKRLLVQGMVMGQSFQEKETGRYLTRDEVEVKGNQTVSRSTGKSVTVRWEKMSKSKHNGVDPIDAIKSFGVDTTRLLMLADAAPFSQRNWNPEGSKGVFNWQNNMYMLVSLFISVRNRAMSGELKPDLSSPSFIKGMQEIYSFRNRHLSIITHNYRNTHQFMVAIKSMQQLTKQLRLLPPEVIAFSSQYELAMATLISTLAPMAPHFASELWQGFLQAPGRLNTESSDIKWEKPVLEQPWPTLDSKFELPLTVLINHKEVCTTLISYEVFKSLNEGEMIEIALKQEKVKKLLNNKIPLHCKASSFAERGARVSMAVPGLKISEEDTNPSFSKKGRQEAARKRTEKKNKKEKIEYN